jgi:ABC-type siderophore export system fused ATPase/permease subunit
MTELLSSLAMLLAGSAVVIGLLAFVATRSLRASLPALLDLLLAAGLLRLSASPDWTAIGTAAAIIGIRKLVGVGLSRTRHEAGVLLPG